MKKIILSVAALMCGAMVLAQNNSEINQTGDVNNAVVEQKGTNNSKVTQAAVGNLADVSQSGVNSSTVKQSNHTVGNAAYVVQVGGASGQQKANVTQDGEGNRAWANQYGNLNVVTIDQDFEGKSHNAEAFVFQNGKENSAGIAQMGENSSALALQNGYKNRISHEQKSGTEGNVAVYVQEGDRNYIRTRQFTRGGTAYLGYSNGDIVTQIGNWNEYDGKQIGDNNLSIAVQTGGYTKSGDGPNEIVLRQNDENNISFIFQGANSAASANNMAKVTQNDNGWNISGVNQLGANTAIVTQSGLQGNLSSVNQIGTNVASVTQSGGI